MPTREKLALAVSATLLLSAASLLAGPPTVFPDKDWEPSAPEAQGVDAEDLRSALDYLKRNAGSDGIEEVVVIRNGGMLWQGDRADKVHGVWSCTKSFTSTVLGLLVDDGKCTLDTPAARFVPALSGRYPQVTLRHFATMTSGYRAVGDEPQGSYVHGPSKTPFDPSDGPLFAPPGSQYAYWDSAMNMHALVLTKVAGESIEELFRRRIADPIGMDPDEWSWGDFATIDGVVVNGGSGNSGRHILISARQMARLGHLFLNQGTWKGRQLISSGWVKEATSVHVPATMPWAQPESGIDGRGVYGLSWWVNGVKPDGRRNWPDAPLGTFAASGHNNNRMFVVPEWNLVVVRLGLDQKDVRISENVWNEFLRQIGQSIRRNAT